MEGECNHWTQFSIKFANQRNYLDQLYKVYPCIPEDIRDIDQSMWERIEQLFHNENKPELIKELLKLDLFPIKDSYVAYLKRDHSAIERNPETINRLWGRLRELGLDVIYSKCTEPKETNRQMGQKFRQWVEKGCLGAELVNEKDFLTAKGNVILRGSDQKLTDFARTHLGYNGDKGLDLVAKFNGKCVVGEAKFLTDFGGHQNAQFQDALNLLRYEKVDAIKLAILDGVVYIPGKRKMYQNILEYSKTHTILSSLVLREFLYQL